MHSNKYGRNGRTHTGKAVALPRISNQISDQISNQKTARYPPDKRADTLSVLPFLQYFEAIGNAHAPFHE